MNILVTGASGFLGSHIVDACIGRGDRVRVLVRRGSSIDHLRSYPDLDYACGDLNDQASLIEACRDMEVVYHCAARVTTWGSWEQFHTVNELGTRNVVNVCAAQHVRRLVYISSPSVVFHHADQVNIDETYPFPRRFANHYCRTKAAAESYVLACNGINGLSTVALRPHAVWGPGDKIGFFPHIVAKIASNRFRKIMDGKKQVATDLCYIQNAVHACLLAAESTVSGKAFFITDGEPINVWDSIDILCDTFGFARVTGTVPPRIARALGAAFDILWKIPLLEKNCEPPLCSYRVGILTSTKTYSIEAARRDLGYAPLVGFREGLARLKAWVDDIGGVDEFIKYV